MRSRALFLCVLVLAGITTLPVHGQHTTEKDSLQTLLSAASDDTVKASILNRLSFLCLSHSLDSMIVYAEQAIALSRSLHYENGLAEGYKNLGTAYYSKGYYQVGLQHFFEAKSIAERAGNKKLLSRILHNTAAVYFYQNDVEKAVVYANQSLTLAREVNDLFGAATTELSLCECYQRLHQPDKGIAYCERAMVFFEKPGNRERLAHAYHYLAENYMLKNDDAKALDLFRKSAALVTEGNFNSVGVYLFRDLGNYYFQKGKVDSAKFYFHKTLRLLRDYPSEDALLLTYQSLASLYDHEKRYDSSAYFYKLYASRMQEDFDQKRNDLLSFIPVHDDLQRKRQALLFSEQQLTFNRTLLIMATIALGLSVALLLVIYYQYRTKRKTAEMLEQLNRTIQDKNDEIVAQSEKLMQVNEEIQLMNENLEETVRHRTEVVNHQNQKLLEYTYLNAHRLRGPLASILGLVALTRLPQMEQDKVVILEKLGEAADELDKAVHEINEKLGSKNIRRS